jgi:hypothetical protein
MSNRLACDQAEALQSVTGPPGRGRLIQGAENWFSEIIAALGVRVVQTIK